MVYLIIMVLVAAIGIGTLYFQQRSHRAHLDSVDGFRESLQKIAPEAAPGPFQRAQVGRPRPGGARRVKGRPVPAGARRVKGRPIPLDARRRAEARRRLEVRRRRQMARTGSSRNAV